MKKSATLLIGISLSFSLFAGDIPEIDKEDIIIVEDHGKPQKSSSVSDPKVVILNNQQVDQDQQTKHDQNSLLLNQPIVRVMGTPISTTYATELKKSRQNAELQTEQKIVEKLESSRLRDEQERLNKLFGAPSAPSHVVSSQPQFFASNVAKKPQHVLQAEVTTPVQTRDKEKVYIGVHGGQSLNLTRALEGINAYGSVGFSFGAIYDSGLIMESSFFYTNHQLTNNEEVLNNYSNTTQTENMDQFSGFVSLKYTPLSRRFQPYIGVTLSYSHRIYKGDSIYLCKPSAIRDIYCGEGAKTNSIDFGANLGMDFKLSKKVSVGFNMLVNVNNLYNTRLKRESNYYGYNSDSAYDTAYSTSVKPEETNWIIASINAKLYF